MIFIAVCLVVVALASSAIAGEVTFCDCVVNTTTCAPTVVDNSTVSFDVSFGSCQLSETDSLGEYLCGGPVYYKAACSGTNTTIYCYTSMDTNCTTTPVTSGVISSVCPSDAMLHAFCSDNGVKSLEPLAALFIFSVFLLFVV